jgi:hypothetical protein
MTLSQQLVSNANSVINGIFGVSNNATQQIQLGQGFYTATTAAIPATVAFSQINGTGSINFRPPIYFFASGTA